MVLLELILLKIVLLVHIKVSILMLLMSDEAIEETCGTCMIDCQRERCRLVGLHCIVKAGWLKVRNHDRMLRRCNTAPTRALVTPHMLLFSAEIFTALIV